jgi:hypothetical protein
MLAFERITVLRGVMPCNLAGVYRRFGGKCHLHLQGKNSKPSEKNDLCDFFILKIGAAGSYETLVTICQSTQLLYFP